MGTKTDRRSLVRRKDCFRCQPNLLQGSDNLILQITGRLWSLVSVFGCHVLEQVDCASRQMCERGNGERFIQVFSDNLAWGSEEWRLAGQHEIKCNTQGVDIRAD